MGREGERDKKRMRGLKGRVNGWEGRGEEAMDKKIKLLVRVEIQTNFLLILDLFYSVREVMEESASLNQQFSVSR